jgi:hypothetical protein
MGYRLARVESAVLRLRRPRLPRRRHRSLLCRSRPWVLAIRRTQQATSTYIPLTLKHSFYILSSKLYVIIWAVRVDLVCVCGCTGFVVVSYGGCFAMLLLAVSWVAGGCFLALLFGGCPGRVPYGACYGRLAVRRWCSEGMPPRCVTLERYAGL